MLNNLHCPECNSTNLASYGHRYKKNQVGKRVEVPQYRCRDCKRVTMCPTVILPTRDAQGRFTKQ